MTKSIEIAVGVYQRTLPLEKLFSENIYERNALAAMIDKIIRACAERAVRDGRIKPHEKEDLIQEVWVRLLADNGKVLKQYNPNRGMIFESYITMIVNCQIGILFRKRSARRLCVIHPR